jgi:exopolysaccharide biosynthesis WecB/TagA/CpsF family protein
VGDIYVAGQNGNSEHHERIMRTSTFPSYKLFLPNYCVLNCEEAAKIIVNNGSKHRSFGVTALAVHGLMESYYDPLLGSKINKIDMILPDGQPIVWALNLIHGLKLRFKVPGPALTSEVLRLAHDASLKVFLYGSTIDTLTEFKSYIRREYPNVNIVGFHEDRFREATAEEDELDIRKINESGAQIVLVGRGCPRQEHWVADHIGSVNAAMLAVGAAFDYHAGKLTRAPYWMQLYGFEWFYRLLQEPRRLWRRYLLSNSQFIYQFARHKIILQRKL